MRRSSARDGVRSLAERLRDVPQVGTLTWMGVRPAREAPIQVLTEGRLTVSSGLEGDRGAAGVPGKRGVTLVQREHLAVIAALAGRPDVDPTLVRRNLVIEGINLASLRLMRFRIGDALLEGTGACEPCAKMEEALGRGGFQAMRGHGGITARVLEGAVVRLGALVRVEGEGAGGG